MERIVHAGRRSLNWAQPGAAYEPCILCSGDDIYGALYWEDDARSVVMIESAEGRWRIFREGRFGRRVRIDPLTADSDLAALFTQSWTGRGLLELADGRRFHWVHTARWFCDWAFVDDFGEPQLCFKARFHTFNGTASVDIRPAAMKDPAFPLLLLIGWYLMVETGDEKIAAATMSLFL